MTHAPDGFADLGGDTIDGLADVSYWGKYTDAAENHFAARVGPAAGLTSH